MEAWSKKLAHFFFFKRKEFGTTLQEEVGSFLKIIKPVHSSKRFVFLFFCSFYELFKYIMWSLTMSETKDIYIVKLGDQPHTIVSFCT